MKKSFMFSLLLSLLLTGLLIAGGVWFYSDRIAGQLLQFNVDATAKHLSIIVRQYDKIFNAFQLELNREARKAIVDIAAEIGPDYVRHSPAQLKDVAAKYGCDEIYFIDNRGKVVNTTFKPDLNLDLFAAGIYFENFLRSVYGKGVVFTPQASIGMNTGVLNKYVYFSPENSDYIIEISYNIRRYIARHYTSSYYEFLSFQKINELVAGNRLLTGIDLITAIGNGRSWSLVNAGRN